MNLTSKLFVIALISFFISLQLASCKKDKPVPSETDKLLYDLALCVDGYTWYKNSSSLLNKSAGSGHPQPFLKTRFNRTASANLDSNGKVIPNSTFAEGSLIVKELYESSSNLTRYAILYKKSDNKNADAKGWVWGYMDSDGTVAESATKKGEACITCHSQSGNIDYTLMNKFFP